MEKYSVLMSVYAKVKPKELTISIQSMLDQTYKPDEFVLVWNNVIFSNNIGYIFFNFIK